jgi:tetratricopeptide (TPR) repeat protein
VLAFLYAQDPEKEEKAVDLFRQVCQTDNDTDTWTEYARLLETRDLTAAVEAYQTLNKQMVEKGDFSLSMLNNLAAVLHSATDYDGAEKTYLKALEICNVQMKAEEDESSLNEIRATVMYNLARLYEERYPDDLDKAMKLYRDILELFPQYIDGKHNIGYWDL